MEHYIIIYTDGSCNTERCIGAWTAIILFDNTKKILSGTVPSTTHQRMELTAVIKSLEYIHQNVDQIHKVKIYTDSQYVIGINTKTEKLVSKNFLSNKGNIIANQDLVKYFILVNQYFQVEYFKIKAHQKRTEDSKFNIEADKMSRKLVRNAIKGLSLSQSN